MFVVWLQAEEFHSTVHILLEWLAEAEQSLRFHGNLPDDEEALRTLIEQHKASGANIYVFLKYFRLFFKPAKNAKWMSLYSINCDPSVPNSIYLHLNEVICMHPLRCKAAHMQNTARGKTKSLAFSMTRDFSIRQGETTVCLEVFLNLMQKKTKAEHTFFGLVGKRS